MQHPGPHQESCHRSQVTNDFVQLLFVSFIETLLTILCHQPFSVIRAVVERLQKDISIPADDSALSSLESWSRLREKHRPLITLTQDNMSEVSASSVLTASRQVCLMDIHVLLFAMHSPFFILLLWNSLTCFSFCFACFLDVARSTLRECVQKLELLMSSHVSSIPPAGTLHLLPMMMFVS